MAIFFSDLGRGREPETMSTAWADDDLIATFLEYERRARSLRSEIFDDNVINESCWPLLQDLFSAYLAGERMRTKELCVSSGLPQTTVLRYLDHLEKFELIMRDDDPKDNRVTLVSVTDAGAFWLREYYTNVVGAERNLMKDGEGMFSLPAETHKGLPGRLTNRSRPDD